MIKSRFWYTARLSRMLAKPSLFMSYSKSLRRKVKGWAFKVALPALHVTYAWFRSHPSAKLMASRFIKRVRINRLISRVVGKLRDAQLTPTFGATSPHLWQRLSSNYVLWSQTFDTPSQDDLEVLNSGNLTSITVGVAVWVDDEDPAYIEKVADCLKKSVGPILSVVFVANGRQDNRIIEAISAVCAGDARFSTNLSGGFWDSEFLILISEGAVPRVHAAAIFTTALVESPESVLAYSDSDTYLSAGHVSDPWFKPCFSPLLAQQNKLIGPMFSVRSVYFRAHADSLARARGNLLSLYCVDVCSSVRHGKIKRIPHVLYHTKVASVSRSVVCHGALKKDLAYARVSIVIPTKDRWDLLGACLNSLWRSNWPSEFLEIIVVDNGSSDLITLQSLLRLKEAGRIAVLRDDGDFNWSRLNNTAASIASGRFFIFLNNDTEVRDPDWIKKLLSFASKPDIGAVGCKLLYPDLTVQHGGVVAGIHGGAGHAHLFLDSKGRGYQGLANLTHEVSAVTGACLAVERKKFFVVGGFNESLNVAFNDTEFCFSLLKKGFYNVYVADALLVHHESKSRGYDDSPEKQARNREERKKALALHSDIIKEDPFYSPNLSLYSPYTLSFAPRRRSMWTREPGGTGRPLKIFLLSCTHAIGHGVAVILKIQADYLTSKGYEVVVGGPVSPNDFIYPGCLRVEVEDPMDAAALAVDMRVDLVIAHTPPFFSVSVWLGNFPWVLAYDHGEPPPHWFSDREERQRLLEEKDLGLLMATDVYAISEAIANESRTPVSGVIQHGNTHLGIWNDDGVRMRDKARKRLGFNGSFVVLNVCRFHDGERVYKGVDTYGRLCAELARGVVEFPKTVVLVLCGKGREDDVKAMTALGLKVFANVTDVELVELYCAADAYMNFSKWEGYNLGVAQALAMGLPTLASDIPAHRAFGIETSDEMEKVISWLKTAVGDTAPRSPILFDWGDSLNKLEAAILSTCGRDDRCSCPDLGGLSVNATLI